MFSACDGSANMSAPFAMRLGATVPNFPMTTTEGLPRHAGISMVWLHFERIMEHRDQSPRGDYQFHDLLARNPDCPWTVLMTHPKDYTPVRLSAWDALANAQTCMTYSCSVQS